MGKFFEKLSFTLTDNKRLLKDIEDKKEVTVVRPATIKKVLDKQNSPDSKYFDENYGKRGAFKIESTSIPKNDYNAPMLFIGKGRKDSSPIFELFHENGHFIDVKNLPEATSGSSKWIESLQRERNANLMGISTVRRYSSTPDKDIKAYKDYATKGYKNYTINAPYVEVLGKSEHLNLRNKYLPTLLDKSRNPLYTADDINNIARGFRKQTQKEAPMFSKALKKFYSEGKNILKLKAW